MCGQLGILSRGTDDELQAVATFGAWGLLIAVVLLGTYLLYKWSQRRRIVRQLQMERVSVEQLQTLMREGEKITTLDVRLTAAQSVKRRIPGARAINLDRIEDAIVGLTVSDDIVTYCLCPNEASAVTAARELQKRGFRRVRPLLGGIDAWTAAGLPLEAGSG